MYIYIYIYIHTYIHTYIHACMHTYIHTYIYIYVCIHTYLTRNVQYCISQDAAPFMYGNYSMPACRWAAMASSGSVRAEFATAVLLRPPMPIFPQCPGALLWRNQGLKTMYTYIYINVYLFLYLFIYLLFIYFMDLWSQFHNSDVSGPSEIAASSRSGFRYQAEISSCSATAHSASSRNIPMIPASSRNMLA